MRYTTTVLIGLIVFGCGLQPQQRKEGSRLHRVDIVAQPWSMLYRSALSEAQLLSTSDLYRTSNENPQYLVLFEEALQRVRPCISRGYLDVRYVCILYGVDGTDTVAFSGGGMRVGGGNGPVCDVDTALFSLVVAQLPEEFRPDSP
jgi:hypothetical protein